MYFQKPLYALVMIKYLGKSRSTPKKEMLTIHAHLLECGRATCSEKGKNPWTRRSRLRRRFVHRSQQSYCSAEQAGETLKYSVDDLDRRKSSGKSKGRGNRKNTSPGPDSQLEVLCNFLTPFLIEVVSLATCVNLLQ